MSWNAKPESATMPPPSYPKSQSSFLQQALINPLASASQSSFNYPGSNQETCMYPTRSNPISQPLLNIKNYTTPQQISVSDMQSGTHVVSQTSVERKAYPNIKPKQLNRNLQMSSGVTQNAWLSSPMRNPMPSHRGATVISNETGFGGNTSNIHTLQNQFVTSDTYSLQLQTIPSNSAKGPVTYQGNQGLNPSLSERQFDWTQQNTPNGLTFPDYRLLPKQHCYSQQSFLHDSTLQKQNPMLSAMLEVKNSPLPSPALYFQSQQNVPVQSNQYVVPQIDHRPPPPTSDCRYASRPLQNTQHVSKYSPTEVPQNPETHLTEILKDLCRDFEQWRNPNKGVNTNGSFCNLKANDKVSTNENFCNLQVNGSVNQPVNKRVRFLVDGVQTFGQNNQGKKMDSGNCSASNQVLDTNITKEGLVSDIKALVEMKKKFLELARKIKINKKLLMAAGCSKATNTSHSESTQNSELSLKQTSKIQSGPPVNVEIVEGQASTVMKCAEETNRIQCTMNSSIQEISCRKLNQDKSVLLNSNCSENLPVKDQLHDLQASLKTSTVEISKTLNNTQLSSENVRDDISLPADSETITAAQPPLLVDYVSKYPNKNTLLQFLMVEDKTFKNKSVKNASETNQDLKPNSFEINQNSQITCDPANLKAMETQNTSNTNAKVSDRSFCLDHKSSTNGMSSQSDNHCSMELLATCLSLWKKQPSEPTVKKHCNELKTNRTTVGISKPTEVYSKSPCAVLGNSQNKVLNNSELQTASPVAMQNFESSGANLTKGPELQIAVVSPLILSPHVRAIPIKGITSEALPDPAYPVIKEGSVCSLQDQLAENMSITGSLKADVNKLASSTTASTKISLLIQNEKQDESANCNSESVPNTNQEKHIKSKFNVQSSQNEDTLVCPDVGGNQQVLYQSTESTIVSDDTFQIANICSLVEGDKSYNSQIAKILNSSSVDKVESQKPCLPDYKVISCRQQKEKFEKTTENKNFSFQKEKIVQVTDVSPKITDQSESLPPSESSSLKYAEAKGEILEENKLECIINKESTTSDTYLSTAVQQDITEIDTSYNYTAQDSTRSEILSDETSILYLHDQLSELLKEFPYGIEAVNSHEGSVGQHVDRVLKVQNCDKTGCDSKDLTDQIKITIISSEQMKELFPEQDDQPSDGDRLIEPQKEKPITKVGSQCDPKAHAEGESKDSVVSNVQKDDIHCCALGWLSLIYEGVPQCQCNSIKNLASKEENRKDQGSPLETNSCEKGKKTSDTDVPVECNNSPDKDLKPALTLLDGKSLSPEIKEDKSIKDTCKTKLNSLIKTEELPGQFSSKCDKKLDPLQSHKRKRKLQFHEVTFHSSSKMMKFCEQDSQGSVPKKQIAQNSCPLKAKTVILTNKNKDPYAKNGSLIQSISPEKIKLKFKAGGSRYKLLEERRSDRGHIFDMERRKKYDKREQNKNMGNCFKLCNSLSNSNERTSIKEKTVSIEVKSTNLEINIHRSLMKSSNSNIKASDSKDVSCKFNRVLTSKEYLHRQKHKEAMSNKASKQSCVIEKMKNISCDSEYVRPAKHSMRVESCGKSNERHSSLVQTSKEGLNILTSHGKTLKIHHSEESKIHKSSKNIKGKVVRKQPDKIWMDKTKTDKHLTNINSEGEFIQMAPQAKDQRKRYLNRVAFKCTERESISLSKLENSPRKPITDTERSQENKPKRFLPVKDTSEKPTMLEFKLCPDALFENTNGEEWKKPSPRKEQAPVQVSGIKSTKEAWLKCVNTEKRMRENNQKIDNNVLPKSKLPKRSISADGLETLQDPVKDSKAMFQTYKKMYMEKRSRSLGNSPLK
ncbi:retroelement silencing factor 1 [Orycteropus afer afer]|uniref:Retroelement silencing factor 1 n=1 Tax=Orycteropus afer afer TaxID=1230840 RepID=A0A8B7A5E2_ORYAF|nr:retroelement silencing factor 1 [Orycteropus afer afer]